MELLKDVDVVVAQQAVAQLDTNPLTTFTELVLKEEQKQEEAAKKDGVPKTETVVGNTCPSS